MRLPTWSASSQVPTEKPALLILSVLYCTEGPNLIKVCVTNLNKVNPCYGLTQSAVSGELVQNSGKVVISSA
jgi:hypothetical protein